MNKNEIPKIIPNCGPNGRRLLGRPLKRLFRRGRNRSIKASLRTVDDGDYDDDDSSVI